MVQTTKNTRRYIELYRHFQELILSGQLSPDTKMPSIRRCSQELSYSRTTVETAYLMLAAEGYLYSKPQSGYYVTDIARAKQPPSPAPEPEFPVRYDFTTSGSASDSQSFDLWKRYVKSALRQEERLSTYGEPQGEADLRQELAKHLKEHRGILCSPDSIVIGAGVQSLLNILCPLLSHPATVSFSNPGFTQAITIFENFGNQIHYKDKDADIIYVAPARMTRWGTIMPVKRRMELIRHAKEKGSLIIEDDYENEFVDYQKPTPSLQALSGGTGVVYISTFSRLLLPSIRLSFMVLPRDLAVSYLTVRDRYNQTASKTEQIALCQYIRDGHLAARIRKLKRLYASRMRILMEAATNIFGDYGNIRSGEGGFTIAVDIPASMTPDQIQSLCRSQGIRIQAQEGSGSVTLLLSCGQISEAEIPPACQALYALLTGSSYQEKREESGCGTDHP